jgi:membrane-bound inhibitor of C-type lysozyme
MNRPWKHLTCAAAFGLSTVSSKATELTIHLAGSQSISRQTKHYQCDAAGASIGLPSGPFAVDYLNGAGNSLAIVPVDGNSMVFANVTSGSGARYAAGQYIWWEAGGGTTFYSDSLAGKRQSVCHAVNQ